MNTKELALGSCLIYALSSFGKFQNASQHLMPPRVERVFSPQESWPFVTLDVQQCLAGAPTSKNINILCMETEPTCSEAITLVRCFEYRGMIWAEAGSPPASPSVRFSLERTTHQLSAPPHTQTSSKYIHLPSSLTFQCSIYLGHGVETWLGCEWRSRPMPWNCLRNKWVTCSALYRSRVSARLSL